MNSAAPNRRSKRLRVSAVLPLAAHGRPVLKGARHALNASDTAWSLRPTEPATPSLRAELDEWNPDIALVQSGAAEAIDWCSQNDAPYVLMLGGDEENRAHALTASIDDRAVGRRAADYFMKRNYRRFGFAGNRTHSFSVDRYNGFKGVLEAHGRHVECFLHETPDHDPSPNPRIVYHRAVATWLEQLEKPLGIFASNDTEALMVIQAATEAGMDVPNDVAILGAGDDPLICHLCSPDLSSVKLPFAKLGARATQILLKAWRHNRRPNPANVAFEPVTTITRGSTATRHVDDPVVRRAIDYFAAHIQEPIKIRDLIAELRISRPNLERRFKTELGDTPLVELRRMRIEQARRLLADTRLTNAEIAVQSGFTSDIRFVTVFKEQVGMPPVAYREQLEFEEG